MRDLCTTIYFLLINIMYFFKMDEYVRNMLAASMVASSTITNNSTRLPHEEPPATSAKATVGFFVIAVVVIISFLLIYVHIRLRKGTSNYNQLNNIRGESSNEPAIINRTLSLISEDISSIESTPKTTVQTTKTTVTIYFEPTKLSNRRSCAF